MKKLKTTLLLVLTLAMLIPILSVAASNCNHKWEYQSEEQTSIRPEENQHIIYLVLHYKCSKCQDPETRYSFRQENHKFLTDSSKTTCKKVTSEFHRMYTVKEQSCKCGKKRTLQSMTDYPHQFTRKYDSVKKQYLYKCGCGYQYYSGF